MASQAVNVNSTLNYIASVTGIPIATVRSWFPNESSQRSKILNIKSTVQIFNKMLQVGFGVTVSSPVSSTYDGYACSANTLKALYSKMMTGRTWNLKTATSQLQYGHWYNSLTTTNVSGSATGGFGGGSGSAYGADTFDVTSGAGANGGPTRIYKNGTEVVHMAGGAGGAGIQVTGGKSAVADNGNAGSAGTTGTYSVDVTAGDKIGFFPAYGGGGSCGVRSPNTYVGPSASYASGANASNDGESTNNNTQGGGGGGASGYDGTTIRYTARGEDFTKGASMNYSSEAGGSIINATIGSVAEGGRGGDQSDTTSSLGGVYVSNSQRCGGGNGGRSGSITITSITSGFIFNDLGGV